jgi:hypothetical protein
MEVRVAGLSLVTVVEDRLDKVVETLVATILFLQREEPIFLAFLGWKEEQNDHVLQKRGEEEGF